MTDTKQPAEWMRRCIRSVINFKQGRDWANNQEIVDACLPSFTEAYAPEQARLDVKDKLFSQMADVIDDVLAIADSLECDIFAYHHDLFDRLVYIQSKVIILMSTDGCLNCDAYFKEKAALLARRKVKSCLRRRRRSERD